MSTNIVNDGRRPDPQQHIIKLIDTDAYLSNVIEI